MSNHALPEGSYLDLSQSMRLHYLECNPDSDTAVGDVIFLHGSGPGASGWSNFQFNVKAFTDAGYRVFVLDLPGYGFSSKPQDALYTLDFFVGYLQEFVDTLDLQQCILVGNSLGGAIATGFTLNNPQRVSHLVLMASGGLEEREVYFQTEGIQAMVKYPLGSPEFTREVLQRLLGLLVFDQQQVTEELVSQRWQILQMQNPQALVTMAVPNLTDRLSEIQCPILGFWGADDKFCPISGARTLVENCRDAKIHMLTQCGHWVMVEYADYFNRQCIEFLQGTARSD